MFSFLAMNAVLIFYDSIKLKKSRGITLSERIIRLVSNKKKKKNNYIIIKKVSSIPIVLQFYFEDINNFT